MLDKLIKLEREAQALRGEVRNRLTPIGLTSEQFIVLNGISEGQTSIDIAGSSHMLNPSVSRIIKVLIDCGLVKLSGRNGRKKTYKLTRNGGTTLNRGLKAIA